MPAILQLMFMPIAFNELDKAKIFPSELKFRNLTFPYEEILADKEVEASIFPYQSSSRLPAIKEALEATTCTGWKNLWHIQ